MICSSFQKHPLVVSGSTSPSKAASLNLLNFSITESWVETASNLVLVLKLDSFVPLLWLARNLILIYFDLIMSCSFRKEKKIYPLEAYKPNSNRNTKEKCASPFKLQLVLV